MNDLGWLSVVPPLLAILMTIFTRQVFPSLLIGIYLGWTILSGWNPIDGLINTLNACVDVFSSEDNVRVVLFSLLVGSLIVLTQRSGGVDGFVNQLVGKGRIKDKKGAQMLAWLTGVIVFIESNITILTVGAVSRPLFDKLKISRAKLAYICDSTSSPMCILLPLNAWGAYVVGILSDQNVTEPVQVLLKALPLNFYSWLAVISVIFVIITGKNFKSMAEAERKVLTSTDIEIDAKSITSQIATVEIKKGITPRTFNMLIPIATMVLMMPVGLYVTGSGNIFEGSGSTAVFWSVSFAIIVGSIMYLSQRILTLTEITDTVLQGASSMVTMALLMVLAFAIGRLCNELGTGPFLAQWASKWAHPVIVPALLFIVSSAISFSTGTSWGTFAIMLPIGIPFASLLDVNLSLIVGSILSGGVFGDHCSPISDTTIISSLAAGCDHIDHVKTQLPYALSVAGITIILFLAMGLVM